MGVVLAGTLRFDDDEAEAELDAFGALKTRLATMFVLGAERSPVALGPLAVAGLDADRTTCDFDGAIADAVVLNVFDVLLMVRAREAAVGWAWLVGLNGTRALRAPGAFDIAGTGLAEANTEACLPTGAATLVVGSECIGAGAFKGTVAGSAADSGWEAVIVSASSIGNSNRC